MFTISSYVFDVFQKLTSIGFMTFVLSYKYSMYPDWLGRES